MCRKCIVLLCKGKGDKCEFSNTRGISLLIAVGKLYRRLLIDGIKTRTDGNWGKVQGGFKSWRDVLIIFLVVTQFYENIVTKD